MLTNKDLFLFIHYSYFNNFFNLFLNLMPPFIRKIILKTFLGKLGNNVLIDYGIYMRYLNKIYVGNNVEINRGCEFYPSYKFRESKIIIGDNVVIAPKVIFFGAGQNSSDITKDVSHTITIHDSVYIGGGSIIRYGVEIGKNSIVAAGSIVVKDIPESCIYGGVPAKFIKKLI